MVANSRINRLRKGLEIINSLSTGIHTVKELADITGLSVYSTYRYLKTINELFKVRWVKRKSERLGCNPKYYWIE